MDNRAIAGLLRELATRRQLLGDEPMRTRAFERAADTLDGLDRPVADVEREGGLLELPGVGKAIAAMVREALSAGRIDALARARADVPAGLLDLLRIPGMGAKKVRAVWQTLGVESVGELEQACAENRLVQLAGFGAKTQEKILEGIRFLRTHTGRHLWAEALRASRDALDALRLDPRVARAELGGEVRRGAEVVSEIVLVVEGDPEPALTGALEAERDALERERWRWRDGLVLRVVSAQHDRFALAWLRATADAAHLARLQAVAAARGTSLERAARGLAKDDEIYLALGLPIVPPELREGAELPTEDELASLVAYGAVRGSLHNHSRWSDGAGTLDEMVGAAVARGSSFHGVTDHSKAASYANGLDAERLNLQAADVARVRRGVPEGFLVLHGCEVDILADGQLDLPDEVLARLDFVVASIHSHLGLEEEAQTRRLVRAVSHPLVTILGHPSGRLLLGRPGCRFDLEAVARAAAANDVALEINASPHRLDLAPERARRAVALGCRVAISPDAHSVAELDNLPLGETVARRAGIPTARVLNACDAATLGAWLRARRARGLGALGLA